MIIKDYTKAVEILSEGGIVALPTETVYGLAARADSDAAVAKIYSCKRRPKDHPLIIHVAQSWDLMRWVKSYPKYVDKLITHFWPGPLTLVFNAKEGAVSTKINCGLPTIAIRCPRHPLMQKVLELLQIPLAAPSANLYGKVSPTSAEHVQEAFLDETLTILDGGLCSIGIESTILLVTQDDSATILRPGAILAADLAKILPEITILETSKSNMPISGNKITHYQPNKKLYLFENTKDLMSFYAKQNRDAILWLFTKVQSPLAINYLPEDPKIFARKLYSILIDSDKSDKSFIMLQLPPDLPKWAPVRERLLKAGERV